MGRRDVGMLFVSRVFFLGVFVQLFSVAGVWDCRVRKVLRNERNRADQRG